MFMYNDTVMGLVSAITGCMLMPTVVAHISLFDGVRIKVCEFVNSYFKRIFDITAYMKLPFSLMQMHDDYLSFQSKVILSS